MKRSLVLTAAALAAAALAAGTALAVARLRGEMSETLDLGDQYRGDPVPGWAVPEPAAPSGQPDWATAGVTVIGDEDPLSYQVELMAVGPQRMVVRRALGEITGKQPGEVLAMLRSLPATLAEDIDATSAEAIANRLDDLGATARMRSWPDVDPSTTIAL